MTSTEAGVVWLLFLATSVYGHVALKLAVGDRPQASYRELLLMTGSFWGLSALAAWALSCFLWMAVLSKHSLLQANSISTLRYVLISLSAWCFLSETPTWTHGIGIAMIATGILLVVH